MVSLPIPGRLKITSVINAPPNSIPSSTPATEIKGLIAFGIICFLKISFPFIPPALKFKMYA